MVEHGPSVRLLGAAPLAGFVLEDTLEPERFVLDVKDQLDRILASEELAVPDRAKKFLKYLVDETLAGRSDRIKAYSIAIEVFGRSQSFDAQNDPVVRIEAGRIRRALERYYLIAGQADPILISVPKGCYIPRFARRLTQNTGGSRAANESGQRPDAQAEVPHLNRKMTILGALAASLAVGATGYYNWNASDQPASYVEYAPRVFIREFEDLGIKDHSTVYARGVSAEIASRLARFKDIIVITAPTKETYEQVPASGGIFDLGGSIHTSGTHLHLIVNLLDGSSGEILWTRTYDGEVDVGNPVNFQKYVADRVATEIGQAYGVIARENFVRLKSTSSSDTEAYTCLMSYYGYRQQLDGSRRPDILSCLEKSVERFPEYATAWALLAAVLLDEERFGPSDVPKDPTSLERAFAASRTAISLDPNNIRAQQALMTIYFLMDNVEMGLQTGREALALNPNDMELTGEFGIRLAASGSLAEGAALIEKALADNPSNANYYLTSLAMINYLLGHYAIAADLIRRVENVDNPLPHLIAAATYAQSGMMKEAQTSAGRFYATKSDFLDKIDAELKKRNFSDSDKAHFLDGIRKAGLSFRSASLASAGQ
ncbi:hypothetical protein [Neorhizobium petrolearium]|uniref:hypothetical protein n=1 Tax=Neorhizobium petrolearium TaxID=515361 RepID=UPI003F7EEFB2